MKRSYVPMLPPILFPSQNKTEQAWMTRLLKEKKIRPIGPRLYTSLPDNRVQAVLRASWSEIITHLFPNALLSHRSALEYRPSSQGEIFLTANTNRKIKYPGLTLVFIRGPKPLLDDSAFLKFTASSYPRALLENFSSTKKTAHRTLTLQELEFNLETYLQTKGVYEFNRIRDRAHAISKKFQWEREFKKLNTIMGALLGTHSSKSLKSDAAKSRAMSKPYDIHRLERIDILFSELMQTPLIELKDEFKSPDHFRNKAFFESYFSNYIEGTIFEIEEAEEIVFKNKIQSDRPKDSHDILGTFHTVSDPNEMKLVPDSFEDFEVLMQKRHELLVRARPEMRPGQYKIKPNRAGDTHFVLPELVRGTLEKGFERYKTLPKGLHRAIFIMFLITEVHPFTDGNGRVARIMMNAEVFSEGLTTMIIPTAYREDYILSLRALTRMNRAQPLIKMLVKSQKFSNIEFSPYPKILKYLENHNWFREPDDAKLIII